MHAVSEWGADGAVVIYQTMPNDRAVVHRESTPSSVMVLCRRTHGCIHMVASVAGESATVLHCRSAALRGWHYRCSRESARDLFGHGHSQWLFLLVQEEGSG